MWRRNRGCCAIGRGGAGGHQQMASSGLGTLPETPEGRSVQDTPTIRTPRLRHPEHALSHLDTKTLWPGTPHQI